MRRAPPPTPTEVWSLAPHLEGLQRAQLIVLNVRSADERRAAAAVLDEIPGLRKDDEMHRDVIGHLGDRRPITSVVADLSDPREPGVKKAVARARRAVTPNLRRRV